MELKTGTHHELPLPMPMTERGEQFRPTVTSGPRTRPSSSAMMETTGLSDFSTELQHWTGPVEQELGGGWLEGFDRFASVGGEFS